MTREAIREALADLTAAVGQGHGVLGMHDLVQAVNRCADELQLVRHVLQAIHAALPKQEE